MDKRLLSILACPVCKSPVHHDPAQQAILCHACHLAFPIEDDIPVMLVERARDVSPPVDTP